MDAIRDALAELVATKDAEEKHAELDYFVLRNSATPEQVALWRETAPKARWPVAWAAARAALAQPAAPNKWIGPYKNADDALDALRRSVAELLGTDPESWPAHENAPLAIAAALATRMSAQPAASGEAPSEQT